MKLFFIFFILFFHSCTSHDKNNSPESITENTETNEPCPENYLLIAANPLVGTTADFCVMKYEARKVNGIASSLSSGTPWHNISALDALSSCQSLGEKYDLISNAEWMTIARNIESVKDNWNNGIINRGWSAWQQIDGFQNSTTAPSSFANCHYNQAKDQCATKGKFALKRTHKLSSGREIWDFAGNVYEWVDWTVETNNLNNYTLGPTGCPQGWREIPAMINSCHGQIPDLGNPADVSSKLVSPTNTNLTSQNFIGQLNGGTGGAAMRGGHWKSGSFAGIYSLMLHDPANLAVLGVGFRCVYRL